MKRHGIVLLALAVVALMPLLVWGQAGYGSIGGSVQDPSGAVVPNAKVTITNLATGVATHATSTGDGRYMAVQLPPGNYQIGVEADGFKKYVASGIVVQVDDKLSINASLVLGATTETVTVSTEAPQLRTEDAENGEVVNNSFIMNLPQIDRDPFALMRISGNVQGAESGQGDTQIRMNGGRTSSIDFYVDGNVVTTGRGHALSNQTPSMDAVQEFKVVTDGISAEYGRMSGGYVQLVTKSGANEYHGDAYEYMFNDMFDANSWYQNAVNNPKVHFRQNDYGFTLGGPVSIPKIYNGKNKTFFFADNEYYRYNQAGNAVIMSMPTQDERSGNMTNTIAGGIPTMMYDPNGDYATTPNADGTYSRLTLLSGNGKIVPASQISPTSAAILALLPMPNRPTTAGFSSANNYEGLQNTLQNNFRFGVRLDHSITDNQRLTIHYTTYNSSGGQTAVGGPLFTAPQNRTNGGLSGNVNYDWTARPTLLFNIRASVSHNPGETGSLANPALNVGSLHLNPAINSILGGYSIPTIQEDFQVPAYYGNAPSDAITVSTTYDFALSGTKILNKHTIKFGVEHRRYYDNFVNIGGYNPFTFTGNPVASTSGDHGFGSASSLPNSMGSFLLGLDDWATIQGPSSRAMNMNYNAAYVQDDFKVTSRLTVNLGLRWDREGPTTERHDKIYFWDQDAPSLFSINPGYSWSGALAAAGLPSSLPAPSWVNGMPNGAVELPNTPAFPSRDFQNIDSHQLAPRLGAAFQLDSKTVLRGSFGVMYIPTTGDAGGFSSSNESLPLSDAGNAGWHASTDGGKHYISSWANPFPLPGMVTTYSRDTLLTNQESGNPPGVTAYSQNMNMPHEYTWGASMQRQLPAGFVFEAGYSANKGVGLLAPNNISTFPANLFTQANAANMTTNMASPNAGQTLTTSTTGPTQLAGILEYPYPQYGTVTVLGSNLGSSMFNALNIRVEHRMTHGLSFLLNYTYSRLNDDVGGPEASSGSGQDAVGNGGKRPQSLYSFASTYGLSANDQPHRLVLTYLYQLPFGRGRHWLNTPSTVGEKVFDRVAGGWQLAGNSTYVSGTPVEWWGTTTINTNNTMLVETTYGSYATSNHDLGNPLYTGDSKSLVSPSMAPYAGVSRFNANNMITAQNFVAGNLPVVDPSLRNPAFTQTDLSLMKNFTMGKESRYLQVRAEAQNAFNLRGWGQYNNTLGSPYFGLLTNQPGQPGVLTPRQIQLSARFIF
jgi:hypothetical protein